MFMCFHTCVFEMSPHVSKTRRGVNSSQLISTMFVYNSLSAVETETSLIVELWGKIKIVTARWHLHFTLKGEEILFSRTIIPESLFFYV